MKRFNFANVLSVLYVIAMAAAVAVLFKYDITWAAVFGIVTFVFVVALIVKDNSDYRKFNKLIKNVNAELQTASSNALSRFTLPLIIVSEQDEIIWYNKAFAKININADSLIGKNLAEIISKEEQFKILSNGSTEINMTSRVYRVFESLSAEGKITQRIICFVDITKLQKYAMEYILTRPVVGVLAVDNFDDAAAGLKDSERSILHSEIRNKLENWFSKTNGLVQKLSGDRFLFAFEERYLQALRSDKFSVLSEIKEIETSTRTKLTISIGLGMGAGGFKQATEYAYSAFDMALGRGGDQVAIKKGENDYEFFGGLSSQGEKHSKVRTRLVANNLKEMITAADNVFIMGHRFSDLDVVGSAYALCSVAKMLGTEAFTVLDEQTTMAAPFLQRIAGQNALLNILAPEKVSKRISEQSLLIVIDTHRKNLLECPEILEQFSNIVVIDHHRKAVDYIDNAVMFYHDTAASSTSEMVAELLQYMGIAEVEKSVAEGLLSGIMLDTRNFVFNTSSGTFEVSAMLRKFGADPVEIKHLFADSLDFYKMKSNIIASAEIIDNNAVAVNEYEGEGTKLLTGQAADELLEIKGVVSSYVLCKINGKVNISARTLQENVQIVMEKLGGGGSKTMAACELETDSFSVAQKMLLEAVNSVKEGK